MFFPLPTSYFFPFAIFNKKRVWSVKAKGERRENAALLIRTVGHNDNDEAKDKSQH